MVSVIIPNFNHALYLKERIESVLNQTYQDFEVIILDDKSTDNSRYIIEQYRSHPKITQIEYNEINSGSTFVQWNKGFSLAKGEYIWIAESDDVAEPDFLERIMTVMANKNNNIVLAFSNIDLIDNKANLLCSTPLRTYQRKAIVSGDYFIKHNMLFGCHILNASSVIFSKKATYNIPKEYITFRGAGDYLFWIEIAKQGNVYKESKILDHFRQHDMKVTPNSVASGSQFKEVHKVFKRLVDLGYITRINKPIVVGFWLQRIKKEHKKFNNPAIHQECNNIWIKETKYPLFAYLMYYLNGVIRIIKKRLFHYVR